MNNTTSDLYSLYWSNHSKNLKGAFDVFRCDNDLVDVTLSCEGKKLKAHRIVLSACSLYFLDLFRDNPCPHPVVILRDVKYQNMLDILNFMYQGEVNVAMEYLDSFLKTAELLQVKGLIEDSFSKVSTTEEPNENEIVHNKPEGEKKLTTKVNASKIFQNSIETNEPIEIPPEVIDNTETMDLVIPETSFKTEEDQDDDISENNSTEFIDINLTDSFDEHRDDDMSHLSRFETILDVADSLQRRIHPIRSQGFPCRYCDKVFSHPNSLRLHLPRHSGRTRCELCEAVLSRKYELKVHMRKKHNMDLK